MTKEAITDKVKAIMNEVSSSEGLNLLGEDMVKLEEYIKSCIPDAINLIVSSAPVHCINSTNAGFLSVVESSGGGIVSIPSDFLRLISLKLTGWMRSVSVLHPFGGEIYNIQHNTVTRAGINKPVCVLGYSSSGNIVECYPYFSSVDHFLYAKTSSSDNLNTPKEELFGAICYMCASLVYTIFENQKTGEQMKVVASELIPKE